MQEAACFVYEPLVQWGAGGMLMHEAETLSELMQFCKSKEILLIQDEIFVGFGRTGKLFAVDHLSEIPDIMCFSKGLYRRNTSFRDNDLYRRKYIMLLFRR